MLVDSINEGRWNDTTHDLEGELEPVVGVMVAFRRSTLGKISEAAATLGLNPEQYIGTVATGAARDDLAQVDLLRMAGVEKGGMTPPAG